MSLHLRLAKLSHAQLLELAVEACEGSPLLKNKADALIAQVAPLPAWCVDILLSPDLLLQLFSSLGLSEHAAAGVCSTWSHAYSRQLRRCCYINPTRERRLADVPKQPNGLCMLPGGVLAITSGEGDGNIAVRFVAARDDTDPQALAACRASSLAARRFQWLMGMARTNDGFLACGLTDPSAALYKFALNGSMDELATVPPLAEYRGGFSQCAVHQQTQRAFALGDNEASGMQSLFILDSHLQVIATVEATEEVIVDDDDDDDDDVKVDDAICDLAVHGDNVIVLTSGRHPEGPGLRLLDLDGRFLRTIAAGLFPNPHAVAASHGRAFVVNGEDEDDEDDEEDRVRYVLHVIDIHSGDILQQVRFYFGGSISAVLVDGDEIYIASFRAATIVVLPFAGSDA
jgi:hypothetical protein